MQSRTWHKPATISSARPTCMAAPGTCSGTRFASRGSRCASSTRHGRRIRRGATRTRAYYAETLPNRSLRCFHRRGRRDRACTGHPAYRRQHGGAAAGAAVRSWGGHRGAFADEIYRRPRHLIGGIIIDGGTFDWAAHADQQPALNTPDPSYHGPSGPRPRRRLARLPSR